MKLFRNIFLTTLYQVYRLPSKSQLKSRLMRKDCDECLTRSFHPSNKEGSKVKRVSSSLEIHGICVTP